MLKFYGYSFFLNIEKINSRPLQGNFTSPLVKVLSFGIEERKEKKMTLLYRNFLSVFTLQVLVSASLFGYYTLDDFNGESYVTHYNNLPSVEENNTQLETSPSFNAFLKEAGEVVSQYDLNQFVGVRLIHRHFTLGTSQVMSEEYKIVDGIPSLVTESQRLDEARDNGALPASWILSAHSSNPQMFEASNDSAVKAGSSELQKSPEFFEEMGSLLQRYSLNTLLSIALLKRDSLVLTEGQIYWELNDVKRKRSVVQAWKPNQDSVKSIRTSWTFNGPKDQWCPTSLECVYVPDEYGGYSHIYVERHISN